MFSSRWTLFVRHACLLVSTVFFAACVMCIHSQTISDTNSSSSSTSQFVSEDYLNGDTAMPASPAAAAAQYGGDNNNRKLGGKLAFEAGAGFNTPIGNIGRYMTWGGNMTVGGGMHFNKYLTGLIEYQFIGDKLPGSFIADVGTDGGNAHVWSITAAPVIDLFPKRHNSMYLTGGGGFYRKVTSFTDLACCDYYTGGLVPVVAAHFSSNQGGANVGVGLTHRSRWDDRMAIFAEVRYVWVDTPKYQPFTGNTPLGVTELLPVTFGVRW